jgi:LPPG:FO 2-phospho-L-lactate transferase
MARPGAYPEVVLLAGGVGGARMAAGLEKALPAGALTVVANVGDDDRFHGLQVCPDLDTILYTLAGVVDRGQGWGVERDGTRVLDQLGTLGAPTWMKLGDRDMALHIYRTWRLSLGWRLTQVMGEVSRRMGVESILLPASDDRVPTQVLTDSGMYPFQEWFVAHRTVPQVRALRYLNADRASITAEVIEAIAHAGLVVIAPSNPFLSIEPMLALRGMRDALRARRAPCVAVSPLIGGKAVKGPLDRMMAAMGLAAGNAGIAQRYGDLIDGIVIDQQDADDRAALRDGGLAVFATRTLIGERERAAILARQIIAWAHGLTVRAAGERCASHGATS